MPLISADHGTRSDSRLAMTTLRCKEQARERPTGESTLITITIYANDDGRRR